MPSAKRAVGMRQVSGRNGTDPPNSLPDDVMQEVQNVDFYQTTLGRRRPGSTSDTNIFTGITFVDVVGFLQDHMPDDNDANREVWGADNANTSAVTLAQRDGATVTSVTLKDPIEKGKAGDIQGVSFNGKFYLAYPSTDTDLNRLHVWDPSDTEVRRVGLAAFSNTADTFSSAGTGSALDFQRFYKYAWAKYNSDTSDLLMRSELSTSFGFTPSTSATAAVVTQPGGVSFVNEQQTHWELYADTADTSGTFYRIATVIIDANTATTYSDGALTLADYNVNPAADDTGTNTPPVNAKYIAADESRILTFGNFIAASTALKSEIQFTPVLGDRDIGDDERIVLTGSQKNRIRLGEGDGSGASGLVGPVFGNFLAFKKNQTWKLIPTGVVELPYRVINISKTIGCINHRSIAIGRDHQGIEAVYWMSHIGPFRYGGQGLEYLGHSVEDLRPNLEATGVNAHSQYIPELKQVWFWVASDTNNNPNAILVFDTIKGRKDPDGIMRKGWSHYTGTLANAISSTLMSKTLAASMSSGLTIYAGANDTNVVLKGNDTSVNQDISTNYQAYIKTGAKDIAGLSQEFGLGKSFLMAKKGDTTVNLDITLTRDYGVETRTFTIDLSGDTQATRITKTFDTDLGDATTVEIQIGDTAAANVDWELDSFETLISRQGTK